MTHNSGVACIREPGSAGEHCNGLVLSPVLNRQGSPYTDTHTQTLAPPVPTDAAAPPPPAPPWCAACREPALLRLAVNYVRHQCERGRELSHGEAQHLVMAAGRAFLGGF